MNFSFIVLVICLYFVSQTTVDARAAGRRKNFWPAAISGDYQGDLAHPRFELKRQAGWGKRREIVTEENNNNDDDEIASDHPYRTYDSSARTWFDD